ncbi:MAG: lysophospholipid acyltransferase family protein [Phyllobacterium sp.]
MIATLRIVLVLSAFVAMTIALVPVQYLFLKWGSALQRSLPRLFHRILCRLLGFRVETRGKMAEGRPLLLAANHVSWSDIVVLSSLGEVSFIAKSEVRDWPLFGVFARLQRSVFVERERRSTTGQQASEIATRLGQGEAIVLFAEGTTASGNTLLPFKTSLFGAAQLAIGESGVESVLVQPVSIAYTRLHGMPMGRYHRPVAAWVGDTDLLPHLKGILREGAIDVEVSFGEPVPITARTDRKKLARSVQAEVDAMFHSSLRGRDMAVGAGCDAEPILNPDEKR